MDGRWRVRSSLGLLVLLPLVGFLGLPLAIGLPLDRDDLGVVREPVNEGHGTGRIGKDGVDLPGLFGPLIIGEQRSLEGTGFFRPILE